MKEGCGICDTVCVGSDGCIKTNPPKKHKGKHSNIIAKAWRSLHWEGKTVGPVSDHRAPLWAQRAFGAPLHPWGSALNGHLCVGKSMGIWEKWGKIPKTICTNHYGFPVTFDPSTHRIPTAFHSQRTTVGKVYLKTFYKTLLTALHVFSHSINSCSSGSKLCFPERCHFCLQYIY